MQSYELCVQLELHVHTIQLELLYSVDSSLSCVHKFYCEHLTHSLTVAFPFRKLIITSTIFRNHLTSKVQQQRRYTNKFRF